MREVNLHINRTYRVVIGQLNGDTHRKTLDTVYLHLTYLYKKSHIKNVCRLTLRDFLCTWTLKEKYRVVFSTSRDLPLFLSRRIRPGIRATGRFVGFGRYFLNDTRTVDPW